MTIVVTGGAGFIGSALVRHLLADPQCRVVTIDRLTYAANPLTVAEIEAMDRHSLARLDIGDGPALAALFDRIQPKAVIHLAAETHVDRSIDAPGQFIATNVVGTSVLLGAALRHWERLAAAPRDRFRFVHVSTDEVYGSLGAAGHFHEDSPYAPNSPYAASKAAADHLARAWHVTYGLPVVVTNCSNNYGPRQFPEKLIPLTILNALAQRALPVYGDGLAVRDWLHVDDHARALAQVARQAAPGSRYMVGGAAERTTLDVVEAVCAALDRLRPWDGRRYRDLITFVADRPGHDRRYAADFTRIRRELGWQPHWEFAAGIEATIRWYLDHPQWCAACGDMAMRRQGLGHGQ